MSIPTGIITVSDRAAKGIYADASGPALADAVQRRVWTVLVQTIVPYELPQIQTAIRKQIEQGCRLILTTGGTGISPRDVTPEAVRAIAPRELPGFGETMRSESLKLTPHATLSRSLAVVLDRALIVCLPGKPTAAVECLGFVAAAIPHALEVLEETRGS